MTTRASCAVDRRTRGCTICWRCPATKRCGVGADVWLLDKVHAVYGDRSWNRLSTGAGSKGPGGTTGMPGPGGAGGCGLGALSAVLSFPGGPGRLAVLHDLRPQGCDLETLVGMAGSRWHIESVFEAARQEVCLDNYKVRSEVGWHRYVILVLWAPALLAGPPKGSGNAQSGRGLSLPEIRQLLGAWSCVWRAGCAGFRPGRTGAAASG